MNTAEAFIYMLQNPGKKLVHKPTGNILRFEPNQGILAEDDSLHTFNYYEREGGCWEPYRVQVSLETALKAWANGAKIMAAGCAGMGCGKCLAKSTGFNYAPFDNFNSSVSLCKDQIQTAKWYILED